MTSSDFQHYITLVKVYAVEVAGAIIFLLVLCKVVWHEIKLLLWGDFAGSRKPVDK